MNQPIELILASQSPRRMTYLKQLGVSFHAAPADVDETLATYADPESAVEALAKRKALACRQQLAHLNAHSAKGLPYLDLPILAADTLVFFNSEPFGKPKDLDDAKRILRTLSGKTHQVLTNVSVLLPENDKHLPEHEDLSKNSQQQWLTCTSTTEVTFMVLSDAAIEAYCQSKEPLDKAGAYAIQGLGQAFVSEIKGCYSGVVGLPVPHLIPLLDRLGIHHCFTGCKTLGVDQQRIGLSAQNSEYP